MLQSVSSVTAVQVGVSPETDVKAIGVASGSVTSAWEDSGVRVSQTATAIVSPGIVVQTNNYMSESKITENEKI